MQRQRCIVQHLLDEWLSATHLSISSFSFLENSPKMLCCLTCTCCVDAAALVSRRTFKTDAMNHIPANHNHH